MLGRFLKFFERKSDAYDALLGIGMQTAANIAVTPELALKCTPVFRGVSIRGEVLGSLPFMLYQRRNDGGKDRATDHPLYKLIHDRPNPWTSATEPLPRVEREALLSRSDIGRDFLAATKRQPFDVVHELFENEHVQLLFLFKISLFGTWLVDTMA